MGMRVAVTGTPGTGKTSAVARCSSPLDLVDLNAEIIQHGLTSGHDIDRDSAIADLDAIQEWLADRDDIIIDSHLSHYIAVDLVIVLRCEPDELRRRLLDRGESVEKADENASSERLDLILAAAVERHDPSTIHEIDTTGLSPAAVAARIDGIITGTDRPGFGSISYLESS